jgi:hypothetical protein
MNLSGVGFFILKQQAKGDGVYVVISDGFIEQGKAVYCTLISLFHFFLRFFFTARG